MKAIIDAKKLAEKHNLDMRIIDAEFTLDRSKLLIKFLADNRIDFRNLAKDLASIYKTRIELRQVGGPWSVCSVKVKRDGTNCNISWKRRTRKNGAWKDYADVPLSENSEAYEVEILDKAGKVLETRSTSVPSLEYEGAGYMARIYQISEVRGRGLGR